MLRFTQISAAAILALLAGTALAQADNRVVADYGTVSLPLSANYGNTFTGSAASGFTGSTTTGPQLAASPTFYDDFVFALPAASAALNSAAVTLNLGSLLGIDQFQGRLYQLNASNPYGSLTSGLPASGNPIQAWTTPITGAVSGTQLVFSNVSLSAGTIWALEIRGRITGSAGGSYAGVLNVAPGVSPIPEASNVALMLAGLGVVGFALRGRRQGSAG